MKKKTFSQFLSPSSTSTQQQQQQQLVLLEQLQVEHACAIANDVRRADASRSEPPACSQPAAAVAAPAQQSRALARAA